MIGINDVVEELSDDVFIRGIDPSQPFKPMQNNLTNLEQELTFEELSDISGGHSAAIWVAATKAEQAAKAAAKVIEEYKKMQQDSKK